MTGHRAYDYIVVGAGSSGCVVASRLSEWASVLLLEAGSAGSGTANGIDLAALIADPGGIIRAAWNERISRVYPTEPQRALDGRRVLINRGVVLGGSHSVNGMIYVRGHRADFDAWAQLGNEGWSFEEVLPYFKKSECFDPRPLTYAREDLDYHGTQGPLHVRPVPSPTRFATAFIDAARELGWAAGPPHWDFNGHRQEGGAGLYHVTVTPDGKRSSTARAFLNEDRIARRRLVVELNANAARVLVQKDRAVGVEYTTGGRREQAWAHAEVILCAGAFGSPQLLMLSGIGPAPMLRMNSIGCLVDLPGVGQNLQDHPQLVIIHPTREDTGQSTFTAEAGLFLNTRDASGVASPDLQYHVLGRMPRVPPALDAVRRLLPERYFTICPTLCKGHSRGQLTLRPGRPWAEPVIQPNYLECEADWQVLEAGIALMREMLETKSIRAFRPDARAYAVSGDRRVLLPSDKNVRSFIGETLTTAWHPVGTCKMGPDRLGVVDAQLRVRGVQALRVADASVIPLAPSGNVNAACIMIAEKCAALIHSGSAMSKEARPATAPIQTQDRTEEELKDIVKLVLPRISRDA